MDPLLFQSHIDIIPKEDLYKYKKLAEKKPQVNGKNTFDEMLQNQRKRHFGISSEKISQSIPEDELKKIIASSPEKQKMYEAALEFEAFFTEKMYKQMQKNIPKTGWINGGPAEEIFDDMLTTERVKTASRLQSLGLAEQIFRQLNQK